MEEYIMKLWMTAPVITLIASQAIAQISDTAVDGSMKPFLNKANVCLQSFDTKAKVKKLSPELYKSALEGVCITELKDLRGLYSLHLVRSESHDYLVERLDKSIIDAKAEMVSRYVMR